MNAAAADACWALVGNPNCGKTALFNRLTGSRQKVANYAGVTVERKEGRLTLPSGRHVRVLDLPGAYSLSAASPDEVVTRDIVRGRFPGEAMPDVLVCVVDATNLRLHLRFVLEVRALGRPMVVALNLMDAAARRGIRIDIARLSAELGLPVIETVAIRRGGTAALVSALDAGAAVASTLPAPGDVHAEVRRLLAAAVAMPRRTAAIDDAIDRVVLHPVAGLAILALVMFCVFQAVFAWAAPLQDAVSAGVSWMSAQAAALLPVGPLQSLVVDGVFAGAGTVLEFLPQILVLFAFILALEESGYLPRAAFLLDRLMFAAGLSGRSFIPLLSSFACAIPGIMATRSIQDPRDRLATILVAPLMTCSARLPVYTLLIGALIPRREVSGFLELQGLVLFSLYVAGVASALVVARVMKRWRRDRGEHALLLELPSYRLPHVRDVLLGLMERAWMFVRRVGTVILAMTVLLWFLASFPAPPPDATAAAIEYSLAGRIGAAIQPLFAPLGFGWEICVALLPGLAAREVAVSALGTVYALSASGDEALAAELSTIVATQWSLATGLALLVWYIYAPMCLSTLAVIRRETNGWRHVWIAAGYLFALAYVAALATYQIARLFGA
jgi:ferrous iron transport protein B